MSAPTALIIDTDPALGVIHDGRPRDVDDAFAIVEAIRAPDIELRGISVTFGNAPLDQATEVAIELVNASGEEIPVAPGADQALPETGKPVGTLASEMLADLLLERPSRIAALGPLGNLGTLLLRHPDLASRIEEVVIVGGRTRDRAFYLGDVGPVRDFNFENDVRAARVLLESGVPVVCAGFELSSPVTMTLEHLEAIELHGTRLARMLAEGSRPWFDHWMQQFPSDDGIHPWDSAAICWIRHPELLEAERRGWQIRDVSVQASPGNPDDSPDAVSWLETHSDFEGDCTFLTGFVPGEDETFLSNMVESCR